MTTTEGISITERAHAKLLDVATHEEVNPTETYLRIAVVPGGCSGLSYDLGWDTTRQDADEYIEIGDLRVVMDLKSFLYLEGTQLDFTDGLEGQGFHFHNPQAIRTCACGESFGL